VMLVLFLISLWRGFSTWMRLRFVAQPPDSEKSTAALFKCSCKIYHLKTRQCPRKLFPVTRFVEDGCNFVYKTILLECNKNSLFTQMDSTDRRDRARTNQSHRLSAAPISSCHCCAARMFVRLYQTGIPW
jgi:hypothetical protein